MSVEEELIKALIIKYDESIRLQRKLFDCGFAEALLSIIPINMRNQEALENLLDKRATECKHLKKYLETSRNKVSKLFAKHESNAHLKKFLDFAFFLSTSHDSDQDINNASNSGAKNILQYDGNGILLKDKSTEELNRNDTGNYHESKGVGLQFYELAIDLMSKLAIGNEKNPDTSDEISSKCIQKPTSEPAELFNSTKKSPKSHFECSKCGKSFPMETSKKEMTKCPICDVPDNENSDKEKNKSPNVGLEKEINGKSQKIGNSSDESQNDISNLCCDICGKRYASKYHLQDHKRWVHDGERLYACSICDKRFQSNGNLKIHAQVHESEKLFKCLICNTAFKYQNNKKRHERIVHEGGVHFQCAHCNRRFGYKNVLISHLHNQHFSEFRKPFVCTICNKSFVFKYRLEEHSLTHTCEKPFKCSVCDQYFKYKHSRISHERRFHVKDARYRCKHCDKGYWLKINLIRHLRIKHSE